MIKACRCWLPTLMATRGRSEADEWKEKKAFSGPDWMQPPPKRKCRAEGLCAFTSEPPACFHSFSRTGRACIAACKFRETSELVKYWFCNFPKYLNIWKEAVRGEIDWESGSEASFYNRDAGIYSSVNWCSCSSFLSCYLFLSCRSKWWLLRYLLFYK